MTGLSEILVLILLICGILILPRMMKPAPTGKTAGPSLSLSKKRRAGIVASVLYPVIAALVLKPWEQNPVWFIAAGLVPVGLAWAIAWILAAPKK